MADRELPRASLGEGLRFTAFVALPNVVQGLFKRRPRAVALARRTGADRRAFRVVAKLKVRHGDGALSIRVGKDPAVLLLGRDAIRRALEGSPDPFAADPEPKRSGMEHFQPTALTISRGDEWRDRRAFTESVLDTGNPHHRLAGRVTEVAGEEAAALPAGFGWPQWSRAFRRLTRRVVLGEAAADDDQLSDMLGELMAKSNPPGKGDDELYRSYRAQLDRHVGGARPDAIAGLAGGAPTTDATDPAGQVTHWLFALGDTAAINAYRCLAALATHDAERTRAQSEGGAYLEACMQEAMRLWPTTPMLSRVTTRPAELGGATLPAGTQVLIVNAFNHRDPEAVSDPDRFVPERWLAGGAADEWIYNHFSHGPQGCPGARIALDAGTAFVGRLLNDRRIRLSGASLAPGRPLPHGLDHLILTFATDPAK